MKIDVAAGQVFELPSLMPANQTGLTAGPNAVIGLPALAVQDGGTYALGAGSMVRAPNATALRNDTIADNRSGVAPFITMLKPASLALVGLGVLVLLRRRRA